MPEQKKQEKVPSTFERGANIPTQAKVPQMPKVKPPASNDKPKDK